MGGGAPRKQLTAICVGVLLALACVSGCGATAADFSHFDGTESHAAGPALNVRWTFDLNQPFEGAYIPVERAAPGVDPDRGRVYVASTHGTLWALTSEGKRIYHLKTKAAVEAQPAVDGARDELYVLTVAGEVIALRASDGSERWRVELGGALTRSALLSEDALYVTSETEAVFAIARKDGSVFWRYRREPREGFGIAGHAGLTLSGRRLLTAFGDGVAVALDASDGRVLWETDTSVDLSEIEESRRFVDVDTTPVIVEDTVYVASFLGGLYGLELESGTVASHHPELKSVVGLAATRDALLLSSAENGVVCLNLPDLSLRWVHRSGRGAPGDARIEGETVFVPESRGALLALDLARGREVGRIETGYGVTTAAVLEQGRGFMLSNGGRLFAFTYLQSTHGY